MVDAGGRTMISLCRVRCVQLCNFFVSLFSYHHLHSKFAVLAKLNSLTASGAKLGLQLILLQYWQWSLLYTDYTGCACLSWVI